MAGISDHALNFGKNNNYRYRGKEQQHKEFSDGSGLEYYDYGKRMQDPQIGRWWVLDPKADLLEMTSPYVFCYNNPINFVDPNGNLAIFINGLTSKDGQRANASYWGDAIVDAVACSGIPYSEHTKFVDGNQYLSGEPLSERGDWPRDENRNISTYGVEKGDLANGNSAQARNDAGYLQGRVDFDEIMSHLARDPKSGKIIEKIEIYAHSRGAAFGAGYTQALLDEIANHADQFADSKNEIDLVYNMAPNEAGRDGTKEPDGVTAFSITHGDDPLSSPYQQGTKTNFHTEESVPGALGMHMIASFQKDLETFTKAFVASKGDNNKLINEFVNKMQQYGVNVTIVQ